LKITGQVLTPEALRASGFCLGVSFIIHLQDSERYALPFAAYSM